MPCEKVFLGHADSEGPDQTVQMQSDQSRHCPLTESLDTTECRNGEQWPR